MNKSDSRMIVIAGILLAVSALLGAGLLWLTNWHATPYIEENERLTLLHNLSEVMPSEYYDNDLLSDVITVNDPAITGGQAPAKVYRARKNGKPAGLVMTLLAPDGYSGPILLLLGVNYQGDITGVSVLKHTETPGLGDSIEADKSDWLKQFLGLSEDNPGKAKWKVKKDGGEFTQFTGATITPRAVVKAIYNGLDYYRQHREALFRTTQNKEQAKP